MICLFLTFCHVNIVLIIEMSIRSLIQATITEHLLYCFNDTLVMVLFKSEMILVGCIKQQKNEDQEKTKTKQWAFFFLL